MTAKLSLRMEARLEELQRIDAAIGEFAREQDWPPDLEFQIKLVFEELGINVVKYGHDDGAGHEIEIEIVSDPDGISFEIADDGRPFDPLNDAPEPDTESALEERAIGGLGVHLVRTMMDEVRYRHEAGRNRTTVVKRISK